MVERRTRLLDRGYGSGCHTSWEGRKEGHPEEEILQTDPRGPSVRSTLCTERVTYTTLQKSPDIVFWVLSFGLSSTDFGVRSSTTYHLIGFVYLLDYDNAQNLLRTTPASRRGD